jgi:hypothetical protein
VVAGLAVLGLNALAAAWGGIAWLRRDPSVVFWYVLRAAQAAVVVQAVLGFVLLAQGEDAPDGLHVVYGIAPLVVAFVTEGMRVGAAQVEVAAVEDVDALERREQVLLARRVVMREMGVMTIGTLMIVTLSLRAAGIF